MNTTDLTQEQKILAVMLLNSDREWWKASDFMQPGLGSYFVGYEASARLSELAAQYDWVETKKDGRFKLRKLNRAKLEADYENGKFDLEMAKFVGGLLNL